MSTTNNRELEELERLSHHELAALALAGSRRITHLESTLAKKDAVRESKTFPPLPEIVDSVATTGLTTSKTFTLEEVIEIVGRVHDDVVHGARIVQSGARCEAVRRSSLGEISGANKMEGRILRALKEKSK